MTPWVERMPLIGVVGLPPLPGSAGYEGASYAEIEARALADAAAYADAGFDALMVQNLGDLPVAATAGPETVAWMSALGRAVAGRVDVPLGVSVLKNDGRGALAIAQAIGAEFVRVKVWVGAMVGAEGLVQGVARDVLAYRRAIGAEDVAIWADVLDRTGVPVGAASLEEVAADAIGFGRADGLVVTGRSRAETLDWLGRVRAVAGGVPVLAGGGVDAGNLERVLAVADGAIVATAAKAGGRLQNPVDPDAAAALVAAARRVRQQPRQEVRPEAREVAG